MQETQSSKDKTALTLGIIADPTTGKVTGVVDDLQFHAIKHYQGSVPRQVKDSHYDSSKWANWGNNNMQPTDMRCKLEKANIGLATLCKATYRLYGQGLKHKHIEWEEPITEQEEKKMVRKVERFLANSEVRTRWLPSQLMNYKLYSICFSEAVMSADGNNIARIYNKHTEHCRLEKQRPDGTIKNVFYSDFFTENPYPSEKQYKKIPLYQWHERNTFIQKQRNQRGQKPSFIISVGLNTPGQRYYPTPFSKALFEKDGWLDATINVPRIVNAMQKNQITMKYQVCIPVSYFLVREGHNWLDKSDAEKDADYKKVVGHIKNCLIGTDNQLSTLIQQVNDSERDATGTGKIEIIAIDNTKTSQNDWMPNSIEADKQIVIGMGEHPEQIGLSGEGKLTTANGSGQRESWNAAVQLGQMDLDIILSTLNTVSYINGWNREFYIGRQLHTTKDKSETGLGANTADNE